MIRCCVKLRWQVFGEKVLILLQRQRTIFYQCQRDLAPSMGKYTLQRGTGNGHRGGSFLLGESFQVAQPQGFQFIGFQPDDRRLAHRLAGGFEMKRRNFVSNPALFTRPGHAFQS
jgi:hypothetical protein